MLLNKKISIILILVIVLVAVISSLYFLNEGSKKDDFSDLEALRIEKPNLTPYINEVEKYSKLLNDEDVATYADLGLAFKSLADQTKDKKYYQNALDIYAKAVDLTKRKNTVFILNAGNMAVYTGDYQLAKNYYEEAVAVAPGDIDTYQKLIELHMYQLKSPKEEIIAIFDKGINRMFNPASLKKWKEFYLESLDENK